MRTAVWFKCIILKYLAFLLKKKKKKKCNANTTTHRFTMSQCIECDSVSRFYSCRKIHYDDDDYVALNVADELEEEEILSEKIEAPRAKYHRPRRKRKRKRRKVNNTGPQEELVDPEELPPRARWTIVATACLLLTMSLLLVGVTLRMAPIIDDMGEWPFKS